MGLIVSPSDFVGKWAIPDSGVDTLTETISDKESEYMVNLLGASLWIYFQTLLPITGASNADYKFIYNAFNYDYNCALVSSKGMKSMLLNFIWFETMRKIKFKATNEGIVVNSPDSSKESAVGTLWFYYNDAVDTYAAIQMYICRINPGPYSGDVAVSLSNPSGKYQFNGTSLQRTIPLFGL